MKFFVIGTILLVVGCAPHKSVKSYRFVGCQVSQTWKDPSGVERKSCECARGRQIGFDAKTGAIIIRCE